jgi:hypothetical protein
MASFGDSRVGRLVHCRKGGRELKGKYDQSIKGQHGTMYVWPTDSQCLSWLDATLAATLTHLYLSKWQIQIEMR